ncbi:copper resistance system multicopper oxidase [Stenotrophomonas sp. MMGLT7]|uniref:copper resistance system multicopper oxidase n=1 Tax=Stenotrophomonas sp. MMGLT7 TaxID=2901227 RepID=UPI001E458291|nr:copper resistance system multicopper oxidase [Stenotrophomonas sp. MMGLT7]MCD7098428.1 copper resistance system multicopper oxidase [Stenotrophomonas sp. MMGLT7]
MNRPSSAPAGMPPLPSRRRFVTGLAVGATAASLGGLALRPASAAALARDGTAPYVLQGSDFELSIGATRVNFTGRERPAITVNGSLPAPILRWREGDTVNVRVSNRLPGNTQTSVHWHGIVLPANMDGVPGLSFDGIYPGQAYQYRFRLNQSGTYWYHSHSLHQEQAGLYGAIVVDPVEPPPYRYDREHVVLLSDWTDLDPAALFRRLKKMPSHDNYYQRTVGDFLGDVRRDGLRATLADRGMWGRMRMTPSDLSDVNGHTYTYLMNGVTPCGNWTGLFRPGEKLLLRFINAANMTYFDIRIPGLKMTVVAADGQYVHPVTVDELRIAVAETFDVIVEPSGQDAFTLFAQDMGRTGHARGTLAAHPGLEAPVPALDPRPLLTMADMGHDMAGMDHGSGAAGTMDHAAMAHAAAGHAGMDHAGMTHGGGGHPASERGNPLVDMQSMATTPKLDDPGIGLRDNGRRVLAYADLHSLFADPDGREPGREIELHLTGNMEKFAWSFDGIPFAGAEPLRLNYGERMRIVLVNDTMMQHPIHLHGMWSDLEDADGRFQVRKHTVDMPPGTRRSYRVRADALGRWAFHCHLLYHMDGGMMREVRVEEQA